MRVMPLQQLVCWGERARTAQIAELRQDVCLLPMFMMSRSCSQLLLLRLHAKLALSAAAREAI
jgi:hypothetical protein